MRKRQKLILMFYAFSVFIISFVYVPYTRYWQGGSKTFMGHHLRRTIGNFFGIEWKYGVSDTSGVIASISIDAPIMIAEVIALTAIATATFLMLKRE